MQSPFIFSVSLIIFLGFLLSKYIGREVKSKERADNLARSLQNANDILNKINQERAELMSFVVEHLKDRSELKDNVKMVSLSNLFNAVAELEQGRIALSFSSVNLNQLAEEAAQEAGDLFKNKNITLVLHKSNTLGEISIDEEKIKQVVMKLLNNAARYSQTNSTVEIFVRSLDDSASLCVKDTGIGFVKGEWENLFDKFYRGRQATKMHSGGTGLSMYWCRKIIEAHGGSVIKHSMGINRGAEFGFYLPKTDSGVRQMSRSL